MKIMRVPYLKQMTEVLAEIELSYLLSNQGRWKSCWFELDEFSDDACMTFCVNFGILTYKKIYRVYLPKKELVYPEFWFLTQIHLLHLEAKRELGID
ncbi:hypothetical protein RhiirA1_474316 [Rhizophagus irregularis]|uniref:Uncharacterized protein n=1 Tax=Rhizophagus irregularis TaxID=588596 RepID=A0A2I1F8G7_9GLOM|nr:hypothetical protein RhiirA1_474316 [Rhizophagus irregularis]PKY30663.1 hypothetical protein RhiirB3_447857 [Rhizophagus irregularis]